MLFQNFLLHAPNSVQSSIQSSQLFTTTLNDDMQAKILVRICKALY